MTKVAFICLGAYNIEKWNSHQNFDRQSVYSIALHEALTVACDQQTKEKGLLLDFFVVENTIRNEDEIIEELRTQFSHERIKDVQLINNNSLGSQNKGAGEYFMCRAVLEKHKNTLSSYDWIIYYTLRQIIISPLILTAIAEVSVGKHQEGTNIIVANPVYLYLDGTKIKSAPGNFCDMIFAMKPDQFFNYIESMSPEELIKKKMSSEMNLFDFVETSKAHNSGHPLVLERLGAMRHNYAINKTEIV